MNIDRAAQILSYITAFIIAVLCFTLFHLLISTHQINRDLDSLGNRINRLDSLLTRISEHRKPLSFEDAPGTISLELDSTGTLATTTDLAPVQPEAPTYLNSSGVLSIPPALYLQKVDTVENYVFTSKYTDGTTTTGTLTFTKKGTFKPVVQWAE